jgi:hypothetical protein
VLLTSRPARSGSSSSVWRVSMIRRTSATISVFTAIRGSLGKRPSYSKSALKLCCSPGCGDGMHGAFKASRDARTEGERRVAAALRSGEIIANAPTKTHHVCDSNSQRGKSRRGAKMCSLKVPSERGECRFAESPHQSATQ